MKNYKQYYYSGTSGIVLPVPNKLYYPEEFKSSSRLTYYASLMNSVEINSSFYKIPQPGTVKRWATEVPADFRFTFKLFREITHSKNLIFDSTLVSSFFQAIAEVNHKKGCILVQLPPSVRIAQLPQLISLLTQLRQHDPHHAWHIAIEFRHTSLLSDEVFELLHHFKMTAVLHDKTPASFMLDSLDQFYYLRFHGPNGDYRGTYGDDLLTEYATYICAWLKEEKQVYVYFNNTMGAALQNLKTLNYFLENMINKA